MTDRTPKRHLPTICILASLAAACVVQDEADPDLDDAPLEGSEAADPEADVDEFAGELAPDAALSAPFTLRSADPELPDWYMFYTNPNSPLLWVGPGPTVAQRTWRTDELGRIRWDSNTSYCLERWNQGVRLRPCSSATAQKWSLVAIPGYSEWYYVRSAVTGTQFRCIENFDGYMALCSNPLYRGWIKAPA